MESWCEQNLKPLTSFDELRMSGLNINKTAHGEAVEPYEPRLQKRSNATSS